MSYEHSCNDCSQGCSARHTEEKVTEEVAAGPYLLFAGAVIVVVSIFLKWIF